MNIGREIKKAAYVRRQIADLVSAVGGLTAACGDQAKTIVLIQATTNYVRAGGTASSLSALTRMELAMREEPALTIPEAGTYDIRVPLDGRPATAEKREELPVVCFPPGPQCGGYVDLPGSKPCGPDCAGPRP